MNVLIRSAKGEDVPSMLALVKELAAFEREPEAVTVSVEHMLEAGFGKDPVWVGWVAEASGGIVGMAICYVRYSTWRGRCLYLEDIVVTEKARNHGIGKKLFRACVMFAIEQGHHHMLWQVLDWNKDAMRFYERLGATFEPQWVNGRLTREQMQRILDA
jgi:GNAT superfamily N-acetyltransferase